MLTPPHWGLVYSAAAGVLHPTLAHFCPPTLSLLFSVLAPIFFCSGVWAVRAQAPGSVKNHRAAHEPEVPALVIFPFPPFWLQFEGALKTYIRMPHAYTHIGVYLVDTNAPIRTTKRCLAKFCCTNWSIGVD